MILLLKKYQIILSKVMKYNTYLIIEMKKIDNINIKISDFLFELFSLSFMENPNIKFLFTNKFLLIRRYPLKILEECIINLIEKVNLILKEKNNKLCK